MSTGPRGINATLVGIEGSGVRTLIGSLTGTLEPALEGERLWEGSRIHLRAYRPESVDLTNADVLVVVTSARQGVPSEIGELWRKAAEWGMPALIVVTHLDDAAVDLEEVTAMCTRVLSDGGQIFLPWLPILDDDESVCGFINLLSEEIVEWSDGGPVVHQSEQRHQELIEDARAELCESVMLAVDDDTLFAAYMSGAPIDGAVIESHMLEQASRGLRHPVIGTALHPHLLGVGLLLDTIAGIDRQRSV